jgi:type III secretory pathway component EscS
MNSATHKRALWMLALRQPSVWARALKFGITVGLVQALVNQGDHWLRHEVGAGVVLKTIVSPLISVTLVLFTSAATWVQNFSEHNKA